VATFIFLDNGQGNFLALYLVPIFPFKPESFFEDFDEMVTKKIARSIWFGKNLKIVN
jgi:hypothetical protein